MTDIEPQIRQFLETSELAFEVLECDPQFADTAQFCEHYGIPPGNSANTILVRSKKGEPKYAVCVLLATDRLDVNHAVRQKLGVRKVSFASAEETRELTAMEIGGVTPLALADDLPVWVDEKVMQCEYIILGGGNRESKLKVGPGIFKSMNQVEIVPGLVQ